MIDLASRHLLVVGGTGTIGSAVVERALASGATVTATGSSPTRFPNGSAATWVPLDVTAPGGFDDVLEGRDVTDIVVAAAARPFASLVDMPSSDLVALVDTKLWGSFHAGRAAAKHLPDDGTLTFISGLLASYPDAASPVAAVSAAVESLGRGLAVELAPKRVNVVSPTALGSSGRGSHTGTADDVADAILFLIGNAWMSGSVIELHGAERP